MKESARAASHLGGLGRLGSVVTQLVALTPRRPYPIAEKGPLTCVGGTGIEPVTSSVSGKRSPAELTAREAEAGIEPAYRALQALA